MRAIVVNETGGPEVLTLAETDPPAPGPGELAIDVAASGVNFIDTYHRGGAYPLKTPFKLGVEGAGTVAAVGEGVTGFAVGDLVVWVDAMGSYAERVLVPAGRAVGVPDGVAPDVAAASLLQGATAHYLTHSTHQVKPGETALVHAAAGGMGLLLTQMIKLRGGRVIGTVSTAEKEKLARDAGADEVIRYTETVFAPEVRRLTGEAGVPVVYDGVGGTTFDGSLAVLAPRGMLALYGQSSGAVPPVDPQRLAAAGSVFLTRPRLANYIATREELLWRAGDVLGWVASGELKIQIGGRYPLAEAQRAHEDLEARRTTGKLLLLP